MEDNPSILVVSSSNTKPKSLIKLLTKISTVSEVPGESNLIIQPWTIDTKYYTAEVNIIGIDTEYERSTEFNIKVEAILVHMDSNKETGLDDLSVWKSIEEDCEPQIKLLISNYCTNDTKVTKEVATQWCSRNGFELIELYPTIDKRELEDEVIKEKFGVDRIIEALQTHTWTNLVMKSKIKAEKNVMKHKENEQSVANKLDYFLCDEFLTNEGVDDFTELFSHLHMMKDSIQSMPDEQRKQCAEQMVTAFWKAIGGEEEEILDV